MIKSLHIKNIAIISQMDIEFDNGLVVLSGETGAGKSIIIDSLSFVLGERADKTLIKYGEESAFVEVVFEIDEKSATYELMQELGYEADTTLVIGRTLAQSGKNECRVNGRVCAATTLKQITSTLVDIFGQSQHLNLLKVDNHIKVLDDYQRDDNYVRQLSLLNADYRALKNQLSAFGGSDAERERLLDILQFQIKEITSANLSTEEEKELIEMRSRVVNVEKIADALSTCINCLAQGEINVISQLSESTDALSSVSGLDKELNSLYERLKASRLEIDDVNASLEDILSSTDYDAKAIDRMEERLDLIKTLKKKYGTDIDAVNDFCRQCQEQYDNLVNATEIIDKLNRQIQEIIAKMYAIATKLSDERRATAVRLKEDIETQLNDLGMKGTTFEVQFSDKPTVNQYAKSISPNGFDSVEFLLSPNRGEPCKPLAKIISGGEMSRFMLAIKNITATIENIPTMVFDEIDTGISGNMAQMVAIKLANVSHCYQCIVITHLPQITAMADENLLITKDVMGDKTFTHIRLLDSLGKTQEVARLIGGANIGEYGQLHAQEMINWADEVKRKI